ncbi:uncharacterized protein BJ212DRAFT_1297934 [Suillus subaureus]|uniref:Tat pathway signal sequence n=1 Tax=Suillus subaureus TaxID=48587 RepID=A0A9P7EG35_9AGAM|nr:uncharacterized protein BJ212DRAFT_1297934 [Suillus subaureus]KAG1820566.1 hypothetical protein BJ212DRAFT_1297934 [Suillus subaureus]
MAQDYTDSPVDEETIFGDVDRPGAKPHLKHRILCLWPWLSVGSLIVTSVFSFTLWISTPSAHLAIYSPASVAVEPVIIKFNGTIDFPSIYRINGGSPEAPHYHGPPPPELDAAWARISDDVPPIRVTINDLHKAGEVDLPAKVKYPQSNGGGFMASLEINHQLRCLVNYATLLDPLFQRDPSVVRMHLDDCIELIRQSIMCNAEVVMITWDWVKNHSKPYPNFNTRHACRKFDNVMDWAVQHADRSEVTRMEDTIDLPFPHQYNI